ncbi:MAG: outer membrane protein assembly factor BamD [Hyphomonadaceae bacterium]|nr:outer membrane protein assembly factor BamD [Hyphomonadaceae bacterium]
MTQRSALFQATTRLAASVVAAGLLFAAPASAQTQLPPPAQYGNADARQDRIEELQSQLTEATAENERLQYELNQRDREIQRLRNMVGELAGVNQSLSTPPVEGDAAAGGGSTTPSAEQRSEGGPAPSSLNAAQQANTGTLGSIPAGIATPPPATAATPELTADELYEGARALLMAGRYPDAEVAFANFLERYPNVVQTPNARFWYAFTLLARNNYGDAAASFAQYLQRTPQGPRAPEAQVRLGMALAGLARDGTNDAAELRQACGAFTSLATRYPNAPRNVRDLAAREARAARCPA